MFNIILYLEKTKLLKGNKALDLGCGAGRISKQLVEHGFNVDAVDIKPQEIEGVNFVQADARSFETKENHYDLIICNNVLPFLSSREEIEQVVVKMYTGLKMGGVMYFTLFGTRDPWVKEQPHMTFVDDFIPPGKMIYKSESFGLGPMMSGDTKIWHQHQFVVEKVD